MPKIKVKSKRTPLAQRYNVSKKAKAHERKQRRHAKANPYARKKLKKDMGIPNLNPYKLQILARMEAQQKLMQVQEQTRRRLASEDAHRRQLGGASGVLGGLAADAAARGDAFVAAASAAAADAVDGGGAAGGGGALDSNADSGAATRRAFYRHLKSVMEKADIILEVLDARDPAACRSAAVESLALAQNPPKRIILVVNKIDLVPPAAVAAWLARLRREFPTIAFKASTQSQRSNLSAPGGGAVNKATQAGSVLTGSGAAGADTLLQLIKNYARSHDIKRAVTVGVVGYPNVGKSSIINSLKRGKAAGVSAMPGFTRVTQEISLDSKVTLIDCPGIIFDDSEHSSSGGDGGAGLLLRNCISVEQIEDPEAAVGGILARCAPEKLMSLFSIPAYSNVSEFLVSVATKRGKLGRGGVPDKRGAAVSVLMDWNSGKIPFYVLPPEDEVASADIDIDGVAEGAGGALRVSGHDVGAAAIVAEWSKVRTPPPPLSPFPLFALPSKVHENVMGSSLSCGAALLLPCEINFCVA